MRTTATEAGHIAEVVTRMALAYPQLHFTLKHNSKKVHDVPSTANLKDRIGMFFGVEIMDRLYPISASRGPATLTGFIADPACERGNNRMQYLFLNGRHIRDRSLGHALQEAYRGLLMTGRYAVSFLFLEMPPDHVDVNVHPTKSEVRFRDAQALFHLVLSTVRTKLNSENLVPKLQAPVAVVPIMPIARPDPPAELFALPPEARVSDEDDCEDLAVAEPSTNGYTGVAHLPRMAGSLRALQLHDSYIVLETPEGMLVIDQHALHERILFEQLKQRWRSGDIEKQSLLVPEPVELTPEQAARTLEAKADLAELGLEVDAFGGSTILMSSYPAALGKAAPAQILRDIVDFLGSQDRAPNREQMLSDLLSMMACKAAVKAGDRLSPEQIAALLDQRHLVQDSHHCPHGRPTSLLFSRKDLDKQFGRI
jgi:DNA mismatch repair protein MutL